jgi:thermostable 8-oxoguanine DNA glycosylase
MIDPSNITTYNATTDKLEELALFWICAAGKNGTTAARCLEKFINAIGGRTHGPFNAVKQAKNLPGLMKNCGIGCYTSKAKSFHQLATSGINLKTCTADDLEKIHGIGMKTSRCFLIHSRKNVRVAGLDTHILKHLRARGVKDVPKSTPASKKQYKRLEKEFIKLADKAGMSIADYDLKVWNKYAVKSTPREI